MFAAGGFGTSRRVDRTVVEGRVLEQSLCSD